MFIRVFDPKGFRIPYTKGKWRGTPKVEGKHGSIEDRRMPRAYYPYTTPTQLPQTKPPLPPKKRKKTDHDEEKEDKTTDDSYPYPSQSTLENERGEIEISGPDIIGSPADSERYTVADCMSSQVVCFKIGDDLKECIQIFNKNPHHYYPVLNRQHRVVGIVSERELLSSASQTILEMKHQFGKVEISKINEIMTSPVVCVERQSALYEVARFMIEESIGVLPVVDDQEKLIGIISRADLLRLVVENGALR